jgi:hypothetical protein
MENMSRKKMCMMLTAAGHNMEDLQMCSNSELVQMCNSMNNDSDMMDSDMMDTGMMENHSTVNYMFFSNLKAIKRLVDEMLLQDEHTVDEMLTNGHSWAVDHIATSKDDVEEVYGFLMDRAKKPMEHTDISHMENVTFIKSFRNFK